MSVFDSTLKKIFGASTTGGVRTVMDKVVTTDIAWTYTQANAATVQLLPMLNNSSVCGYISNALDKDVLVAIGYSIEGVIDTNQYAFDSFTVPDGETLVFGPAAAGTGVGAKYRAIPGLALIPDINLFISVYSVSATSGTVTLNFMRA